MNDTLRLIRALAEAEAEVPARVARAVPAVARAADAIAERMRSGGRWFSLGAGTSGRLAVLDAAELPPTFGIGPREVIAIIAGGDAAIREAVEGAEDDAHAGARSLEDAHLAQKDAVLGVSASGRTPYVLGAIRHARERGALTVGLSCSAASVLASLAEIAIEVDVGSEVLAGSTRLKAGSAQKCVLNMLSTAVMAARGLIHRGEMVAMRPTNAKLRARAERIVRDLTGVPEARARGLLEESGWHLPVALLRARFSIGEADARARLERCAGSVADALAKADDPRGPKPTGGDDARGARP